eukprot:s554_g27.t1
MVPMLLSALVVVARGEHSCLLQSATPVGASLLAKQMDIPGWTYENKGDCSSRLATKANEPIFANCAQFCEGVAGANAFAVGRFDQPIVVLLPQCRCCDGLLSSGSADTYSRDAGAVVIGDPHITTLDGIHYTLLSQGTFSLWHFHGVDTEIAVVEQGFKKMPIDWQMYTHYSGRQSLTKGLLLVDRSGGMAPRQILEVTSKDCRWRAKIGTADWSMVSKPQLIAVPDEAGLYLSGFNLTSNRVSGSHGHHINQVRLNMNTRDGISDIAVLGLTCRPQRSLNLHLLMKRRGDGRFVDGEVSARKSVMLSSLQTSSTSSDAEFAIRGRWQDIGGSDEAAAYFRLIDEDKAVAKSYLFEVCNTMAEKDQAKSTCAKYLEPFRHLDRTGSVFNDCVDDVCHGAGEVAAEMAGELLASMGADSI